jgi:hypothetical protein
MLTPLKQDRTEFINIRDDGDGIYDGKEKEYTLKTKRK